MKCVFSEIHGIIVISLDNGEIDTFSLVVENEGNIDYDEATDLL